MKAIFTLTKLLPLMLIGLAFIVLGVMDVNRKPKGDKRNLFAKIFMTNFNSVSGIITIIGLLLFFGGLGIFIILNIPVLQID